MEETDNKRVIYILVYLFLSFLVYFSGEIILYTTNSTFQLINYIYNKEKSPPPPVEKKENNPAPSPAVVEDTSYDDNILYESIAGGISQHMINDKNSYPHKNPLMYKLKSKVLLNNLEPIKHYSNKKIIL